MSKDRNLLGKNLLTAYGVMSMPDWSDDLIVRTLTAHGEWAFTEQLLVASLIRADDKVWDVGAFLGTFGIGVTQLCEVTPAKLVAVEPSTALYPHLVTNLEQNAPCPFQIAPFAVAAESGRLRPRAGTGTGNAGAVAYEFTDNEIEKDDADVICRTLHELRAEYGDYDVLKLDIEGMENDAIRSDIDYILHHRPVIWAECNEEFSSILLLEALRWLKYEPLYVAFPSFRQRNFNGSRETIYPMAYEAVLLAAPPDRLASFHIEVPNEEVIVRPVETSFDLRRALWSTPRWSMPEWAEMSRPELVAILGHKMRNEELVNFLNDMP